MSAVKNVFSNFLSRHKSICGEYIQLNGGLVRYSFPDRERRCGWKIGGYLFLRLSSNGQNSSQ